MDTGYRLKVTAILRDGLLCGVRRELIEIDMRWMTHEDISNTVETVSSPATSLSYEPMDDPYLAQHRELQPTGLLSFGMAVSADRAVSVWVQSPEGGNRRYGSEADHDFGIPLPGEYVIGWVPVDGSAAE